MTGFIPAVLFSWNLLKRVETGKIMCDFAFVRPLTNKAFGDECVQTTQRASRTHLSPLLNRHAFPSLHVAFGEFGTSFI